MYFALAGISLVCAGALYLLAATFFGTLTSIAITAVISSLLWYLLNEFALRRFVSVDVQDIVKWLLVIGVYAGAFLVTSALVQGWVFKMVVYLVVLVVVTGTVLKSEVIDLLRLISTIINQNEDTMVAQAGR